MKSGYYRRLENPMGLAVLDLVDYYNEGLIITRINVPKHHRRKGIGTALLKECIADADREKITLWLEIAESDGPNYETLEAWYKRHGFKGRFMLKRKPNV
jgi:GNAT superfamily N-acetyltransferase